MAAVAYLSVLVSPGLLFVGQRRLAQSPETSQSVIALVLTLQTLLACVAYAFVLVAASLEPRGPVVSVLLVIQGATLFATAWNTGWALQAHERMVAPSLAALAINVLQLPALMLLVHGPDDLTLYAVLTVAFAFGAVAFNFVYLARRRILRPLRLRPTLAGVRGMLRRGLAAGAHPGRAAGDRQQQHPAAGFHRWRRRGRAVRLGLSTHAGRQRRHRRTMERLLSGVRSHRAQSRAGRAPVARVSRPARLDGPADGGSRLGLRSPRGRAALRPGVRAGRPLLRMALSCDRLQLPELWRGVRPGAVGPGRPAAQDDRRRRRAQSRGDRDRSAALRSVGSGRRRLRLGNARTGAWHRHTPQPWPVSGIPSCRLSCRPCSARLPRSASLPRCRADWTTCGGWNWRAARSWSACACCCSNATGCVTPGRPSACGNYTTSFAGASGHSSERALSTTKVERASASGWTWRVRHQARNSSGRSSTRRQGIAVIRQCSSHSKARSCHAA